MKIIDLLNKIAEGKEVPKKIKYNEIVYSYCDLDTSYNNEEYTRDLFSVYDIPNILNDTVEIIEEDNKKIEMMKIDGIEDAEHLRFKEKINEIIYKINMED